MTSLPTTTRPTAAGAPPRQAVPADLVDRVRRHVAAHPHPTGARAPGGPAGGEAHGGPAALRAAVAAALHAEGLQLGADEHAVLVRDLADHVGGLGPLEALLRQPGVTDVLVNGPGHVWVERDGRLQLTDVTFPSAEAVLEAVRRVVGPQGGRIDRSRPFVDAKLPDGSRLHAVAAPIVVDGPLVTIRRFDARLIGWESLLASDDVPATAAAVLQAAVADRRAVVVCGRTGTGKTTLLQRLLSDVDPAERVVLIEDAPELRPRTGHLVRMETRPPSAEGTGGVDIATLVRQALRMRPDRIVVGEVRGIEVADVLQALITGHEGCMTTVHASSAAEALIRLEGMALQAGLPMAAAQAQLGSAVDVVVALDRGPGGRRGVVEIADVTVRGRLPRATTTWRREGWR